MGEWTFGSESRSEVSSSVEISKGSRQGNIEVSPLGE